MTEINKASDANSLGHIDIPQGEYRKQVDAVSDSLRQLGGLKDINPLGVSDPLNSPFVLYVNPAIGSDRYVAGAYSKVATNQEERLKRISQQRLVAGYTEAQPFKTIERAAVEAGIITSYSYFTAADEPYQQVCIVVSPGVYNIRNGPGGAVVQWGNDYEPTGDQLQAFNSKQGGVVLPRGCSMVSLDLRKTIIRPTYVPIAEDEKADFKNRSCILRMTGQGYYYGFTFKDAETVTTSHHLLTCFEFASKAQLDEFYTKVLKVVSLSDVEAAKVVSRKTEYEIVGPQPPIASEPTDTVDSASPYIYNTSVRSTLGLCGAFLDGGGTSGFKSCVIAQYTGVSLQRDMSSWEIYEGGSWGEVASYEEYINASPNDLRAKPERRSFHIRAVNKAVVQEVSVFAIGQAIHHLVESGGEITVTNSNSNWGGCASLAIGFHDEAAPTDKFHQLKYIQKPVDPIEGATVKIIKIGELSDTQNNNSKTLVFENDIDKNYEAAGYSIRPGDYIWVVNPVGPDYRAPAGDPVYTGTNKINLSRPMTAPKLEADGSTSEISPGEAGELSYQDLAGAQVYIRRLVDTRTTDNRSYFMLVDGDTNTRPPVRDYIPQLSGTNWTNRISTVMATAAVPEDPDLTAKVQLRYSNRPAVETDHDAGTYYRPADVIRHENKHYTAINTSYGPFDEKDWDESYVHMQEAYDAEGFYKNAAPVIIIDGDASDDENSTDLGLSANTAIVKAQIQSAVDYQGLYQLLLNLGKTSNEAKAILQSDGEREDLRSENWNLEFRRPSNIRLFSHAFEWAGYSNYTKAVPKYQQFMTQNNKFNYYFTHEDGGRVYCSGFNEEGFLVTNRGLQDLSTGDSVQLDQIGAPDVSLQPESAVDPATTSAGGVVEIATREECQKVIKGEDIGQPDVPDHTRVVNVEDLDAISTEILGSIEEDIKILPDELATVFIHQDVDREDGDDAAKGLLPGIVNEAFVREGDNSNGNTAANVAYRSMKQCWDHLNGRAPVGAEAIRVWIIGKVDNDNDDPGDIKITHTKKTVIRGYNKDREGDACYMGGQIVHGENSKKLSFFDCTISSGGSISDPESNYVKTTNTVNSSGESLYLNNVVLRNRSEGQSTSPLFQYNARDNAECEFRFGNDGGPTEIHIDGICRGPDTSNYSIISWSTKKWNINAGAFGDNTDENKLYIRIAHTNAANTKPLRFIYQTINFSVRAYDGDPDRQNGKLFWEYDFTGHRGTYMVGLGPTYSSKFRVEDKSSVELRTRVKSIGALNAVELFTCRGSIDPASFIAVDDIYKSSKRNAAPDQDDATYSSIQDYYDNTVTGQWAVAFKQAGLDLTGANSCSLKVPANNIYNGIYLSNEIGSVEYPSNTKALLLDETELDFESFISEEEEAEIRGI